MHNHRYVQARLREEQRAQGDLESHCTFRRAHVSQACGFLPRLDFGSWGCFPLWGHVFACLRAPSTRLKLRSQKGHGWRRDEGVVANGNWQIEHSGGLVETITQSDSWRSGVCVRFAKGKGWLMKDE